jgi:hypothetical protein
MEASLYGHGMVMETWINSTASLTMIMLIHTKNPAHFMHLFLYAYEIY